jgi:hypothetical protein
VSCAGGRELTSSALAVAVACLRHATRLRGLTPAAATTASTTRGCAKTCCARSLDAAHNRLAMHRMAPVCVPPRYICSFKN